MLPIRDILVPLDGSRAAEASLDRARPVARALNARLHLVHVVASSEPDASPDPVRWRLEKSGSETYLTELVRRLRDEGFETKSAVLAGRPAEEIVSYGRRNGADLVVLSRSGKGESQGAPTGGTAHKILYRIGTSVLLSTSGSRQDSSGEDGYRRLLVPVDGSSASEWALRAASSLIEDPDAVLVAARVLESREGPGTSDSRRDARARLERMCRRVARPGRVETELVSADHVARGLHVLADERDADLVVLSAHGRSGSSPWPYGSVATNLLLYGRRPTLVLQDQPDVRRAEPPEREEPVRRRRPEQRRPETRDPGGADRSSGPGP